MNRLIFFAVLFFCLSYLLPNHYPPSLTYFQESATLLLLLFLGYKASTTSTTIPFPLITFVLAIISLISIIQYQIGLVSYLGDALIISGYLLSASLAICIGSTFGVNPEQRDNFLIYSSLMFVFVGVISVWIALKQWLLLSGSIWIADLPPNARPFANLAQPNHLSTLLSMSLIATLLLYSKNKLNQYVALLVTFLLLVGIALTQSRTAWVFIIALNVWWILGGKTAQNILKKRYVSLISMVYVFLLYILPAFANILGVTSIRTVAERATSGGERWAMWTQVVDLIKEKPFTGYGWGQLNLAQVVYPSANKSDVVYGYAHNLFLDIFIWNGLVVGFVISAFILFIIYQLFQFRHNKDSFILTAFMGAVFVHSQLEYPFAYLYFLIPVCLALGVIFQINNPEKHYSISALKFKVIMVLAFLFYLSVCFDYINVNREYQLMRYEQAQLETVDSSRQEVSSIYFNNLVDYIWFARFEGVASDTDIDRMRKVAYKYPESAVLYKYHKVLVQSGRDDEAAHIWSTYNAFKKQ